MSYDPDIALQPGEQSENLSLKKKSHNCLGGRVGYDGLTGRGHKGTFRGSTNFLHLDLGGGHKTYCLLN